MERIKSSLLAMNCHRKEKSRARAIKGKVDFREEREKTSLVNLQSLPVISVKL